MVVESDRIEAVTDEMNLNAKSFANELAHLKLDVAVIMIISSQLTQDLCKVGLDMPIFADSVRQ